MKFYSTNETFEDANPCTVRVGGLNFTYEDTPCFPIIITDTRVVFGGWMTEHESLYRKLTNSDGQRLEARYFRDYNLVTFWLDGDEKIEPVIEKVARLNDALKNRLGYDTSKTRLMFELLARKTDRHPSESFVIELTMSEFLGCGGYGSLGEFLYRLGTPKERYVGDVAKNGMETSDIWRHYLVAENDDTPIQINESDMRYVIDSIVRAIKRGTLN